MDKLKEQIDNHEVICFDIFDTLLMRQIYDAEGVFDIVGEYAMARGIAIEGFRSVRIQALMTCPVYNPNVYEIYDRLQEITGITENQRKTLLELELQTERLTLVQRKSVVECFEYAVRQDKRVFIVSDMYLPAEILGDLLEEKGIRGYERLYVSCDYRRLKYEGLLDCVVQDTQSDSILHVGDHLEHDGYYSIKYGIDYYRVMDMMTMMSCSTWFFMAPQVDSLSLNDKLMLGKLSARLFNNPLVFEVSEIRPQISRPYDIGYCFFAPIVTQFMMWMNDKIKSMDVEGILFSARDGYLFQKLYHIMKEMGIASRALPDYYFMTSRVVCFSASASTEEEIDKVLNGIVDADPVQVLQDIFMLAPEKVEKYEPSRDREWKQYIREHQLVISENAARLKDNYLKYMDNMGIDRTKKYVFFDLASQGTCQHYLTRQLGMDLTGIYYWRRTIQTGVPFEEEKIGCYNSGVPEDDASVVTANYLYLEAILTDPNIPSVRCFAEDGTPIYGPEKRTEEEVELTKEIQDGIIDFFKEYLRDLWIPGIEISKAAVEAGFRFIDPARTRILDSTWNKMNVIDDLMSGKRVPIKS